MGVNGAAFAITGNNNIGIALGTSTAQASNGNSNLAFVLGNASSAGAFSFPLPSNDNIAVALGDVLTARAMDGMTDIVTIFGTL